MADVYFLSHHSSSKIRTISAGGNAVTSCSSNRTPSGVIAGTTVPPARSSHGWCAVAVRSLPSSRGGPTPCHGHEPCTHLPVTPSAAPGIHVPS